MGAFQGEVFFDLDPAARPVVMPVRRIPLAVQDRLADEITRLESLGVMEKQEEPTEWVSSLVVGEKKSRAMHVCIGPKYLN